MSGFGRRAFLQGAVATTGGVLVSGPLEALLGATAGAAPPSNALAPVADLRDGVVRLWLPIRLPVPVVPRHRHAAPGAASATGAAAGHPRRRHRPARPPRRHGRVPRTERQRLAGPQPRDQQPVAAAFGPGTPYDASAGGGTTTDRGDHARRGRPGVHQPERHPDELLGRAHAVGQLDHLRGDGQRARRRPRLHRRVERPTSSSATGSSSRCPPAASRTGSRSPRPDGSPTRRRPTAPTRASSTSPRTTSRSRPGSTGTSRRRTR